MPAPTTPRKASNRDSPNKTPSKPATAAAIAANGKVPLPVKARVAQWHDQVLSPPASPSLSAKRSSVSLASGVIVEEEKPKPSPKPTPKPTVKAATKPTAPETSPTKAAARKFVDPGRREWIREKPPRSSSTPRKRIVSDEHWKKNRVGSPNLGQSAPGTPQFGSRTNSPNPSIIDREREERRMRRRSDRAREKEAGPLGSRAYHESIRGRATTSPNHDSRDNPYDSDIIVELESTVRDVQKGSPQMTPSPASRRESKKHRDKENIPLEGDDDRGVRKSSYAEALDARAEASNAKFGSQKSRKSGILGQIFSKPEPAPVTAPRVPTIEAWLDDQHDPFVDDGQSPVDMPAPLKTKPRGRKSSREQDIPETSLPDYYRECTEDSARRDGNPRRRRKGRPEHEPIDEQYAEAEPDQKGREQTPSESAFDHAGQDARESSPATLRRRGAGRGNRSGNRASQIYENSPASPTASPAMSPSEEDDKFEPMYDRPPRKSKRPPTGGRQLSTIESVASFSSHVDPDPQEDMLARGPNELKRRLTTNDDLMSVLSMPRAGSKKIRSARSVRNRRERPPPKDLTHVFDSLAEDEQKYMRELKTLVDGVIPVLLQCMMSKSDMAAAGGLFGSSSGQDNSALTKPVMDMGIALERLKSLHKRIPLRDEQSLLTWAQGAHRVYLDYIRSWRMGFQDVVVNLELSQDGKQNDAQSEGGMARDAEGDVIDEGGKKVDVAHLLKRPLVRLKHLSKTFQTLNEAVPSQRTDTVFRDYQDLVDLARRRSNEERGRLEDEAAASIDPTKAREPRSLAVLPGVSISKRRTVKARDNFHLTLHHSSGQRIDCLAELLLRDNAPQDGPGGDVLLCELDDRARWLLFPPLVMECLSARMGEVPGEIVMMIRGVFTDGRCWHELVSLRSDDEQTCYEWVQMLGSDPMPPRLVRSRSFINRQKETIDGPGLSPGKSMPQLGRTPSPTEIEVPIGEPSVLSMHEDTRSPWNDDRQRHSPSHGGQHDPRASTYGSSVSRKPVPGRPTVLTKSPPGSPTASTVPSSLAGAIEEKGPDRPSPLRRMTAGRRLSQHGAGSPGDQSPRTPQSQAFGEGTPHGSPEIDRPRSPNDTELLLQGSPTPKRPAYGRAMSSTPSSDLPTISRVRPTGSTDSTPLAESMRDKWASIKERALRSGDKSSKLQKSPQTQQDPAMSGPLLSEAYESKPPAVPSHQSPTSSSTGFSDAPVLKPSKSPRVKKINQRRRSSSPLKHEYAPSVVSDSSSNSDSNSDTDSTSDTSEDELEGADVLGSLPPRASFNRKLSSAPSTPQTVAPSDSASQAPYRTVPSQDYSQSVKTIATAYYWSDKGSWVPIQGDECSIIVSPGLIEAFVMTAAHSGAAPRFQNGSISDASSDTHATGDSPLIGLELTPLVPLRRGTALDISIRSPPIERSKFKESNNIMLRSRNAEECDALYAMINQARINNPTYIALQNARPSVQPPVNFSTGGTQGARHSQSSKRSSSWFFGGGDNANKPSYRASSAPSGPPMSIAAGSENSVGTVTSALRRLSNSHMFNLSRSSVLKKEGGPGGATASLYSSDSGGTGAEGGSGTATPTGNGPASMGGINNLKIRLYLREDQNRWRDMGAARITVLPAFTNDAAAIGSSPPVTSSGAPHSPSMSMLNSAPPTPQMSAQSPMQRGPRLPSSSHTPHRTHGSPLHEKRILITSSKKHLPDHIPLLDVCLHESCFERVARTGIAVSIWEEHAEGIVKEGGVVGGKQKVYMVQCAGEAEASWVFGVVGRSRY